jgi:16S rRNA (cytosine967-C5)-methyltransferase
VLAALARFEPRRVNHSLKAILYAGAVQIIWLDRIPLFAAVDEAVAQAQRLVSRRAAGMTNAVLRNLARAVEQRRTAFKPRDPTQVRVDWEHACAFRTPVLPKCESSENALEHLAAATGERSARYGTLVERFGAREAEAIAWASQAVPPIVLVRNALRVDEAAFQQSVREQFEESGESTPEAVFLPPAAHVMETDLFRAGRAYVQDTTARAAAQLVQAQPGERVLDLCAAPGGKSVALAVQMGDRGEVVACDADPDRLALVRENADRMKLTCIRTHPARCDDELHGPFDAVLVDAPCTNTGVIARRPEARLGLTRRKLDSLVKLQATLIRRAAAAVRPGGRLVYSTCSIEPEENQDVVAALLAENPEWKLEQQRMMFPRWGPRLSDWCDGGFVARIVRAT